MRNGARVFGVMRLVEVEGGGCDAAREAAGGGDGAEAVEEFARVADRERALSKMRWTVDGGGAEICERGPNVRRSAKSADMCARLSNTASGGRRWGLPCASRFPDSASQGPEKA